MASLDTQDSIPMNISLSSVLNREPLLELLPALQPLENHIRYVITRGNGNEHFRLLERHDGKSVLRLGKRQPPPGSYQLEITSLRLFGPRRLHQLEKQHDIDYLQGEIGDALRIKLNIHLHWACSQSCLGLIYNLPFLSSNTPGPLQEHPQKQGAFKSYERLSQSAQLYHHCVIVFVLCFHFYTTQHSFSTEGNQWMRRQRGDLVLGPQPPYRGRQSVKHKIKDDSQEESFIRHILLRVAKTVFRKNA